MLERARRADLQARSDEALELLQGCEDWPVPYNERGVLLRAQVLVWCDPIAALDALPEDAEAFTSDEARAAYLVRSADAYKRVRNLRLAEELLNAAETLIRDQNDPNRYEIALLRASIRWSRRDYDPEDPNLTVALSAANPDLHFKALNMRAWMYGGLEDYRSQVRDLIGCLDLYDQYGYRCRLSAVAKTLFTILALSWETYDPEAARRARAVFESLPWTDELQTSRFLCLRSLAWHAFLLGDVPDSTRLFDEMKHQAVTPSLLAMAYADHAYVSQLSGDEASFERNFVYARKVVNDIDWRKAQEERVALLTLVVLSARIDPRFAERYLSAYARLHPVSLGQIIQASHGPRRLHAHEKYAEGCLQEAMGNTRVAIQLFSDAYDLFIGIDHVFRATLTARALFRLTRDDLWLHRARSHASAFPNSPIAMELRATSTRGS